MSKQFVSNLRQKIITYANPLILTAGLLTASLSPVLITTGTARASQDNTRLDAFGTLELAGSGWLSGGGVNSYSNGSSAGDHTPITNNSVSGVTSGEEWQCVEMVNRLYLTNGWTTTTWIGNGNTLVNDVSNHAGLSKQNNGSITYLNPGDTITLDDGGSGHAAIINSVGSSIQIVNQNAIPTYSSAYIDSGSLSGGNAHLHMNGWGTYTVQAVVHHPNANPAPSTRPGALARSSTDMGTFYQNGSNLVDRYWNSTTGWATTSWAVNASSAPSAVARDSSDMDVFFRDGNNNLVDQHWNSTSGWATTALTSNGSARGNPQVISRDSADMDVYFRDGSNNLVDVHWNSSSGWGTSSWADNIKGDPSPTDRSSGNMDVFFRNTSNNLIDRLWTSTSGWSFATLVSNGTSGGDPGAITPDSGHMDAFYKDGSTGNLYDRWWDSVNGWNTSSWSGTPDANAPSAIARDSSDIDVFYRNGSNNLIDQHWNVTNGWGTTTLDSSGHLSTDPSAIDRDSADMDIFYGTSGGSLADEYWNSTNGWAGTTWAW